ANVGGPIGPPMCTQIAGPLGPISFPPVVDHLGNVFAVSNTRSVWEIPAGTMTANEIDVMVGTPSGSPAIRSDGKLVVPVGPDGLYLKGSGTTGKGVLAMRSPVIASGGRICAATGDRVLLDAFCATQTELPMSVNEAFGSSVFDDKSLVVNAG